MKSKTTGGLQAAIESLLADDSVRQEIEIEARVFITASDLMLELDRLRELSGLSKAELARRAGLHPSNLRKIFSAGTGKLELVTFLRLIGALDHRLELTPIETTESRIRRPT